MAPVLASGWSGYGRALDHARVRTRRNTAVAKRIEHLTRKNRGAASPVDATHRKNPELVARGSLSRAPLVSQRFRFDVRRSRDAACLRAGAVFFAEPMDAAARAVRGGAVRVGADRFGATRFAEVALAAGLLLRDLDDLAAVRVRAFSAERGREAGFAAAEGFAATGGFVPTAGFAATVGFATFGTGLPATAGVAAAPAAGAPADVLPLGRPPLRANCASANILRKAS